ncbi:NADH dehydrogenase [ubiquinone] 1 alpha subcomplex assembly factor 2 [Orussus abietinus]|uniref:NADH dehydrogenase [ubiquinone] 1 alpha subcomplex assembly factor 2 n=1 Tax=Orussus abietinus TaxID=222816 RepID=UPI000626EB87|nr:NADH dehydrogenase [ubiquinone] 1 alpha subcomplex assembly factor 2 [Orussus abietinus]
MAGRERGVFRLIFRDFFNSLKTLYSPRTNKLVGEDFLGTKYYEQTVKKGGGRKKPARSFVTETEDDFDQEIPAEWEAWLRHRRAEPPTEEEVLANYKLSLTKKKNAVLLEKQYESMKTDSEPVKKSDPRVSPQGFPMYDDYKMSKDGYIPRKK